MNPNSAVLEVARAEFGVTEAPLGSNLGPRVNQYKAETWLDPQAPWFWCVAFVLWTWHRAFEVAFPLRTAAVDNGELTSLAPYCRKHKLTTDRPEPGDAACLGGDHITFLEKLNGDGTFIGLGGNQRNGVRRTPYRLSSVTTWISADKVAGFLGLPDEDKPAPQPPLYEVTRGEGQKKTVYLGTSRQKAKAVAARLIDEGRKRVTVRTRSA